MQKALTRLRVNTLSIPTETDIVTVFRHYAPFPWAMLLDSANSQHTDARFDIIVANPIHSVTSKDGITVSYDHLNNSKKAVDDDPIKVLEDLYADFISGEQLVDEKFAELPFKAGLLGYFGYDLGRRFEKFEQAPKGSYSSPDMAVGLYSWSIIKDNQSGQFYLCYLDGVNNPPPTEAELLSILHESEDVHSFKLETDWHSNMNQHDYFNKVAKIHDYLVAGDCYQVNLAQRFSAQFSGPPWQAYLRLRQSNKAPFSAFIQLTESTYMSISPERFVSVKDRIVESKPIKGTRPRSDNAIIDNALKDELLNSEKDKAENLMIADLLRNDMSKSCEPGSINVPALFYIESFAAVHHLVTTIRGKLAPAASPLSLLRNAFPGGSITGAPKIRAMQIIDELEPDKRNIYCGSIGYIGIDGNMDTNICIRTLLCENNNVYCWAGGGIVVDSNAESEYQESLDKVSKILPVLSMHND